MNLGMQLEQDFIQCSLLKVTNEFLEEIRVAQESDMELQQYAEWLGTEKREGLSERGVCVLRGLIFRR